MKKSTIVSYADDTNLSSSGKSEEEVKEKLEQDAENILKFYGIKWESGKPIKNNVTADEYKARGTLQSHCGR